MIDLYNSIYHDSSKPNAEQSNRQHIVRNDNEFFRFPIGSMISEESRADRYAFAEFI